MHCLSHHCIVCHITALSITSLHSLSHHCIVCHITALSVTSLYCLSHHCLSLHCLSHHCIVCHITALSTTSLHYLSITALSVTSLYWLSYHIERVLCANARNRLLVCVWMWSIAFFFSPTNVKIFSIVSKLADSGVSVCGRKVNTFFGSKWTTLELLFAN